MADASTRATDPETSFAAADSIRPHVGTIRERVLRYAAALSEGFIDEELSKQFNGEEQSSYRTRRNELWQENWILDSKMRRDNSHGRECIVWTHRQFVIDAPPLKMRGEREHPSAMKEHARRVLIPALDREMQCLRNHGMAPLATFLADVQAALRELSK